jgi:cytochrome P450
MDIASLDRANAVEMNLGDAAFKKNAIAHISSWARRPPFYVFTNGPPQVVAGRYADVHEIFTSPDRFSSQVPRGPGYEQFDKFMGGQFMTQMDGETHARLRRLVMPAFSARRIEQIEARIEEIIRGLLDDIERVGPEFDAMDQYASKLVVGVLLTAMLDLSEEQKSILLEYQEIMPILTAMRAGEPFAPRVKAAYTAAANLVHDVIEDRRSGSRSDFLTDLVQARDAGDKLSDEELFNQIFGIFAALATTPRSGGGGLFMLYSHPEQIARLVADPTLTQDAVEECLRIAGNGYFTFPRIATCDTEVGGVPILKGMIVRPSPLAANLDPAAFPEPLKFDILRKPKRIMTFGAGPHHCVGNLLGRKTLNTAVRRLVERFPNARLRDPEFSPTYVGSVGELRLDSLPMRVS